MQRMPPKILPPILSPALLNSLHNHPHPTIRSTWYFIAAVTVTVLNRPDEIPNIYKKATGFGTDQLDAETNRDEQLNISRRMREALIKTTAVAGVPKSINALLTLKQVTPVEMQDQPLESPTFRRADIYDNSPSQTMNRGQNFFDMIYGKIAKRVMRQMDYSGTEDLGLTARLMYGHILSNLTVLDSAETSYVMIAGLIPQDVNPQLKGHLRGALNGGAAVDEVRAVRDIVIQICERAGMTMLEETALTGWGWREEVANL